MSEQYPQSAGLGTWLRAETPDPNEVIPPWWQTMQQDPWYITGAKVLLGEREVEGMRRGQIMPYIETLAPLLFMGRGGRMMTERPVWPGARPRPELQLPPETRKIWDYVQNYKPEAVVSDPFNPAIPVPPPRTATGDVYNWEALPYSDRPVPQPVGSPVPAMNKAIVDPQFEELAQSLGLPSFANYTMRPKVEPIPILPPDEPFTPKERQTLGELGMKMPPRSPAQIQQDWENFVQRMMSGGGQSGDMHQAPGGLELPPQQTPPVTNEQPPDTTFDFSQFY